MQMYPKSLIPPKKRRRIRLKPVIISSLIVLVTVTYLAIAVTRPFAELAPSRPTSALTITTPPSSLPWPAYGQGAFGLSNGTVIATNGDQVPLPIASAVKVVTALVILEKHPLSAGESGPTLTMTQRDADLYKRYIAIDGSVMPVSAGQRLTQYQLLQGLMLPSANNVGDTLALWSFGSIDNYFTYANDFLQRKGLKETNVGGDANGYLPDSTSTTRDLVKLGALAMQHPVLAEIVGQKTAVIPDVGTVRNYNNLLGTNGIIGVKTGNNDDNGGIFIGATTANVNGKTVTLITALSGAPSLSRVLRDSGTLLAAVRTTFADTTIVQKDTVLGSYAQPNGTALQAVAAGDLSVMALRGSTINATVELENVSYNNKAGDRVGTITLPASDFSAAKTVPVVLKQSPTKPSLVYRLTHP